MVELSHIGVIAALLAVGAGMAMSGAALAAGTLAGRSLRPVLVSSGDSSGLPASPGPATRPRSDGRLFPWMAVAFIAGALAIRSLAVGHGPFASMYEFSVALAGVILATDIVFERRLIGRTVTWIVLPVAFALLAFATAIGGDAPPLPPSLQHELLLSVHVAVAIVAYGAITFAFAAAALLLLRPRLDRIGIPLPRPSRLDRASYRSVLVAFPFLTLVLVVGAMWAEMAWGSYWSWDPKETAALATWLVLAAYLHSRAVRGWRGRRSAWLVVLGFVAVLFTFFGNFLFGGLHSYSGLG